MARAAGALLLMIAAGCAGAGSPEAVRDVTLRFVGLGEASEGALEDAARREIDSYLAGGSVADLADAAYMMENALREEGFAQAIVGFEVLPGEEDPREVVFQVEEGPAVRIGTLEFFDNDLIPEGEIRSYFIRKGGIFGQEDFTYRERDVAAGVKKIESRYLLAGFLRVRVELSEPRFSEDGTRVHLAVLVRPGAKYTVAEAVFAEPVPLLAAEAAALLDPFRGQPYHPRVPVLCAARVRARLEEEGHLDARVRPATEIDDEAHVARITVAVTPGPRVVAERIAVVGQELTAEGFIRDRTDLEAGEVLTRAKLDRALDRLYRTGLFALVDVEPSAPAPGEEEAARRRAVLGVSVRELEPKSVDIEAGWGSYELLRGAVTYRDRNLFGIGRELETSLHASLKSYGAEARVRDPYLLGEDEVLEAGAAVSFREEPSFDRTRIKFDVTWRHRFDDATDLRTGYYFDSQEASGTDDLDTPEDEGFVIDAGLFSRWRRDARDTWLAPAEGYLAEVGVLWSSPLLGADLDFAELFGAYSTYFAITDDLVLALGARATTRQILDDRETLPIQHRLFLGGESSVRSFFQDELGPVDDDGDPKGGLSALEAHAELRQRLFAELYGTVFYDVGTVGEEAFDFGGPFGHAVGAGLFYLLPVGPVRLDFGWNPGRRFASEDSWALHFSFGFSF